MMLYVATNPGVYQSVGIDLSTKYTVISTVGCFRSAGNEVVGPAILRTRSGIDSIRLPAMSRIRNGLPFRDCLESK